MAKLDSNPTLSLHLDENRPFVYAHLVKFERPFKDWSRPNQEILYSTKYNRYAYITDASYPINFDDGTSYRSAAGTETSNGSQTYHANKLLNVSSVQDSAENKVANYTISMAANSLDAVLYGQTLDFTSSGSDYFIEADESLSDAGFREGDLIGLVATGSSVSTAVHGGKRYIIDSFRNEGKKVKVKEETYGFSSWAESGETYTVSQNSTELTALTLSQGSANFINRQVSVYKAFFYEDQPDVFIGNPVLLFSGIVATASYDESPDGFAKISWTCRSHWGDFQQVRGRIGSDDYHRALNSAGKPSPDSTIRPEYAYDMGFQHANNAVNVIAIYKTTQTQYKEVWRNKLLGTKKLKEYEVEVENEVDLRFNLNASYIPLVYGVRRVGGNLFFADLENNGNADTVYVAETIAEGPIQSIMNVYVDDQPLVCTTEQDADVRDFSLSAEGVDTYCWGRADKGQVLQGEYIAGGTPTISSGNVLTAEEYSALQAEAENNAQAANELAQYIYSSDAGSYVVKNSLVNGLSSGLYGGSTPVGEKGILHDYGVAFTTPQETVMEFKAGLSDQSASPRLSSVAVSPKFKLQNDYFGSVPALNYWGANHKVLDTAYVVNKFTITPESNTIPDIDYVIKGKLVECFNYDGSFGHYPVAGESHSNFNLGDTVSIKKSSDNSTITSSAQIIDKWYYYDGEGSAKYRFRWNISAGQEQQMLSAGKFYMEDGSSNKWTMATYDYKEGNKDFAVQHKLEDEVSTVNSTSTNSLNLTTSTTNGRTSTTAAGRGRGVVQVEHTINRPNSAVAEVIEGPTVQLTQLTASTSLTNEGNGSTTFNNTLTSDMSSTISSSSGTVKVVVLDQIKLAADNALSAVDDAYNGYVIVIKTLQPDGNVIETTRVIEDYDAGERVISFSPDLTLEQVPGANDVVSIIGKEEVRDLRSTTNFALIMYDYLRSKRYGAGLGESKLNKDSFLLAGRVCDTRSDITVDLTIASNAPINIGDKFEYRPSAGFKWQGTIKSFSVDSGVYTVTFTDCIGKLTNKFNKIRTRTQDDLIWQENLASPSTVELYKFTAASGLQTSISTNATSVSSFTLTEVGGSTTLSVAAKAGNPVSYSLYDSDFIDYFKYLGWESPEQRWVTRHQGNMSIDTSQPVFNIIGGMLEHFNGILAYEDGKFSLTVETQRDSDGDLFWNFLSSNESWTPTRATLTTTADYVTLSPTTTDPYIVKSGISFKGSDNQVVRARVKRTSGTPGSNWDGRVFWSTDSHSFSASYADQISDSTILNEWVTLSWDMASPTQGGSDWTDNYITGLRIDLSNDTSTFDIEWISVGSGVRVIESEDIIGSVSLKDNGLSKAYNSLSASILDPQNNFNTRSVSFFNSNYLKQDRGIVRSGSFKLEGITNYYNARLAVEQILNKSRFARQISFTIRPVGLCLSPGEIIRVKYPRFGWDSGKYFRVQSLTYQTDCLVSIVATEHSDSVYFIEAPKASPYSAKLQDVALTVKPSNPGSFTATSINNSPSDEETGQVTLTWTKSTNMANNGSYIIYRNTTNNFSTALPIARVDHSTDSTYVDLISPSSRTTYYYWIQAVVQGKVQTTTGLQDKLYYSSTVGPTTGTTIAKYTTVVAYIYQRTTTNSAPSLPNNGPWTYTFSSGDISSNPNNGWTETIPSESNGAYLWQAQIIIQTVNNDSVTFSAFSGPTLLASPGQTGSSVDIIFIRHDITGSPATPDTPGDSSGAPSGWSTTPPSGTDPLFASVGVKDVGSSLYDWGTPYQVEGTSVAEVYVYYKNLGSPYSAPSGGSYNFSTNTLTVPSGWSTSPPSLTANGDTVYVSVALFSGGPKETAATATWSTPTIYSQRNDGSIGADGKTAKLTPSSSVINYSTAGSETSTITFTTDVAGFTSPYYRFLVNGSQAQGSSTTSTFTLPDGSEPSIGGVVTVKVEVRENNSGDPLATDSVSIYAVQDGSDAVIGFLTNAAHTVSANNSGTVDSFTGSGGTFKVFVGGSDVTTSCAFTVSSSTNVTTSIVSSTGVYSITALSANSGTATYQAVIPAATAGTASDVTITSDYSISKSIKGDTGNDGASLNIIFIRHDTSGSPYSPGTPSASSGVPSGWSDNPGDTTGSYPLFASQGVKAVGASTFTWGAPYQVEGSAVAEVYIYSAPQANGGAAPTLPTTSTYNFVTSSLTVDGGSDWYSTPQNFSANGDVTYVAVSLVSSIPTDTSAAVTWGTAAKYSQKTDGAAGINSRTVSLSSPTQAVNYDSTGSNPSPSAAFTITATAVNTSGTVYYDFLVDGSSQQNTTTNTYSYTPPSSYSSMPDVIRVDLREGANNSTVLASDTFTVYGLKASSNAVEVLLDNSAHVISVNNSGTANFTGSGTTIRVYEGTTELVYDGTGTTAGKWKVVDNTGSPAVMGAGSPQFSSTGSPAYVTVADYASMSASVGKVDYRITGKTSEGVDFDITKTQSFSKAVDGDDGVDGVDGVSLNLTATAVSFTKDGSTYDPGSTSTIALSAFGGTITAVTWSTTAGTLGSTGTSGATLTFANDQSSANVLASATVTAAVTGTTSDGTTGVSFGSITVKVPTTLQGADGQSVTGPRNASGYLYYQSSSSSAPTAPVTTNVTYNWSTGVLSGGVIGTGSTNWNQIAPTFASGNSNKYWYVYYNVTEATYGGTITVSFGSTVYQGIGFSGLVTFSSGNLTDGSSTFDPTTKIGTGGAASDVNTNQTTIDGGKITADTITANQLQISREDGSGSGIWLDYNSGNPRIRIFQGTTERVTIGYLS